MRRTYSSVVYIYISHTLSLHFLVRPPTPPSNKRSPANESVATDDGEGFHKVSFGVATEIDSGNDFRDSKGGVKFATTPVNKR